MTPQTRDWESTFSFWAEPPSPTEQERSDNAIRAIRGAVDGSSKLNQRNIKVFTQGSYRNRVNVRQDSDVDVGVMLYDYFLRRYPEGKTDADFGNIDADYSFPQFKNDLATACGYPAAQREGGRRCGAHQRVGCRDRDDPDVESGVRWG